MGIAIARIAQCGNRVYLTHVFFGRHPRRRGGHDPLVLRPVTSCSAKGSLALAGLKGGGGAPPHIPGSHGMACTVRMRCA